MEFEKLAVFSESNGYYSLVVWNLEDDKLDKAVVMLDKFSLLNLIEEGWLITFENTNMELVRLISANVYEDRILKHKNIFGNIVKGIRFTKNVKDYGYNFDLVHSVKEASNICQYLIMKNKSL